MSGSVSSPAPLTRRQVAIVLLLVVLGSLNALRTLPAVWDLQPNGLSSFTKTLPEWDFANLWAGGKLAGAGMTSTLLDPEAYRAWMRETFTPDLPEREWSYPPTMLLLSVPFAQLPLTAAFLVWTCGTLLALWLALRGSGIAIPVAVATVLSPSAGVDIIFGQTGALTAALFLGGLLLIDRQPIVAGILIGLLTVKPQLGLLLPICLIAAGRWRVLATAIVTTIVMIVATGTLFGWSVFPLYLEKTAPLMRAVLEAPFPKPYQANAITLFVAMRTLGAGIPVSYAIQALAATAGALVTWKVWRRGAGDLTLRVALTACLALLATPYAYSYDMVAYSFATVVLLQRKGWRLKPAVLLCWLWPGATNFAMVQLNLPLTPLILALAAWLVYREIQRDEKVVGAEQVRA